MPDAAARPPPATTVLDILKFKGNTAANGTTTPKNARYNRRLDLNADSKVDVLDVLRYKAKATNIPCTQ